MASLWVPIAAPVYTEARADLLRAFEHGADGVELRLDCMTELSNEQIAQLCAQTPPGRRITLTCRSPEEGGRECGDEAERISRLIALGPLAHLVDVEYAVWRMSANIRQKVMLAVKRARHVDQEGGRELIDHPGRRLLMLSRHYTRGRPPTLSADLLDMLDVAECDVVKLAWTARTIRETFEAFELMRESAKPIIAICMGEAGVLTRLLAGKFGAFATFATINDAMAIAAGQVSIDDMKRLYRWDAISSETAVYGVVGHPVAHSLSPVVHNAGFEAESINAVFVPMLVEPGYESFKALMVEALARPWFGLCGLSITSPHKQNAFRFIRETNCRIVPAVDRIGAVNTLRIDGDGTVNATNTDAPAVREVLDATLGTESNGWRDLPVAVLGAGGMARACAAAMADGGARVTIYNRNAARAASLAAELACSWRPWEQRSTLRDRILINCTTIGQSPDVRATPLDAATLREGMVVVDAVYRPQTTRLLHEARQRGCRTIDGLELFLAQAAGQWRFWLERDAPHAVMRRAALARARSPGG